jgi:hypothetical protein
MNQFMRAQKDELRNNKTSYISPEEREKIEKAKQRVKLHFLKFFRTNLIKKNRLYFNKWKSHMRFEQYKENEFNDIRTFLIKKRKFFKKLKDENTK